MVEVASIQRHYNTTMVIEVTVEMPGWERKTRRHHNQAVEETNHYTCASTYPYIQHSARIRQQNPISREKDRSKSTSTM